MSEKKTTVIFNKLEKIEQMVSGIELKQATLENNFTHLEKAVDKSTEKIEEVEKNYTTEIDLDKLWTAQKDFITAKGVKFLLTILGFIFTALAAVVSYVITSVKGGE